MNTVIVGIKRGFFAAAMLAVAANAQAGYNDPISFAGAGNITLTVGTHVGLFDHILELNNSAGPVGPGPVSGNPLLVPLSSDIGRPTVLGFPTANTGDSFNLGSFAAGSELIFRLSNIFGGIPPYSDVNSQIFSGSASGLNPPVAYPVPSLLVGTLYTYVQNISATQIEVTFEDLFPWDPADTDLTPANFIGAADVTFTLTLTPVPEPESYAMMLAGLGLLGWVGRRRMKQAA